MLNCPLAAEVIDLGRQFCNFLLNKVHCGTQIANGGFGKKLNNSYECKIIQCYSAIVYTMCACACVTPYWYIHGVGSRRRYLITLSKSTLWFSYREN